MEGHELRRLVSHEVIDAAGRPIGSVEHIFDDGMTGRPEWIGVLTGTIRRRHHLVPVAGAEQAGGALRVPWTRERVKRAPTYDEADRRGPLGLGRYLAALPKEKQLAASVHFGITPEGPA